MTSPDATRSLLDALAGQAASGDLRLERGAAEACMRACNTFLDDLDVVMNYARRMSTKSAYGTFGSAQSLGDRFEQKALGDGGFREVVQKHIDTVKQMRDLFDKAGKAYQATDLANGGSMPAFEQG